MSQKYSANLIEIIEQLTGFYNEFRNVHHTVRNLQFLSENSTLIFRENCRFFGGEKLVKMLWVRTFWLLITLISREKLPKNIG